MTVTAPDGFGQSPPAPLWKKAGVAAAVAWVWTDEPVHGAPSALVALAATALLFGSGPLGRGDLARIDWSTLLLIAGGTGLGHPFEASGLALMVLGVLLVGLTGPSVLRLAGFPRPAGRVGPAPARICGDGPHGESARTGRRLPSDRPFCPVPTCSGSS